MLMGLALGKRFLSTEVSGRGGRGTRALSSPKAVYFFSSLLSSGCILGARYLVTAEFEHRFWVYAVLMGFCNGVFSGVAYKAPMLACQVYFPDRKSLVGFVLLLGSALGIATYSGLTAFWAADCRTECADLSHILINLFYCMLGHTIVASFLLSSPRKQLGTDDMRLL